jgi:hypothetical protein
MIKCNELKYVGWIIYSKDKSIKIINIILLLLLFMFIKSIVEVLLVC